VPAEIHKGLAVITPVAAVLSSFSFSQIARRGEATVTSRAKPRLGWPWPRRCAQARTSTRLRGSEPPRGGAWSTCGCAGVVGARAGAHGGASGVGSRGGVTGAVRTSPMSSRRQGLGRRRGLRARRGDGRGQGAQFGGGLARGRGWWGASADPAITEGNAVEGEDRERAFGVGMSDPGRKTHRGGGSSSRAEGAWCAGGFGGLARAACGRKTRAGRAGCGEEGERARRRASRRRGRGGAASRGGGVVRLVDALRLPLRISRGIMP
jgi:hypothetical protein